MEKEKVYLQLLNPNVSETIYKDLFFNYNHSDNTSTNTGTNQNVKFHFETKNAIYKIIVKNVECSNCFWCGGKLKYIETPRSENYFKVYLECKGCQSRSPATIISKIELESLREPYSIEKMLRKKYSQLFHFFQKVQE